MWPGGGTTDGFRSCSAQDGCSIRLLAGVVPLDGAGRVGGLAGLFGCCRSRVRVVVRSRCRWEGGVSADCLTARPRGRCSCSPLTHQTAGQCGEIVVRWIIRSLVCSSFVLSFVVGFCSLADSTLHGPMAAAPAFCRVGPLDGAGGCRRTGDGGF